MALDGPGKLGIEVVVGSHELRISVSGEVDMNVADQLRHVLDELPPERNVIVDFAGVTFCDSSGITAMIQLRNRQAALGHTLSLINARAGVRRVFEMSGLVDFLDMREASADGEPGDGSSR